MSGNIETLTEKVINVAKKRTLESLTRIDGGIIQEDGTVKESSEVETQNNEKSE